MRSIFLITARLKSTRLPRKVMADIAGKPAIVHMLDRLKRAKTVSEIVICTSTDPQDDPLQDIARQEGVGCFRGSLEDVLDRLLQAALQFKADYVLNLTADCPLVEADYVDRTVETYQQTNADMITAYSLPHGSYCWGIKVAALQKVCELKAEKETEIWGDYFTKSGLFKIHEMEVEPAVRRPDLRMTLDYPEDLEFFRRLFEGLYVPGQYMRLPEILRWLDTHPDVVEINRHCAQLYQKHRATAAPMRLKTTAGGAG